MLDTANATDDVAEIEETLKSFQPLGRASYREIDVRIRSEVPARLFEYDHRDVNDAMFKLQVIVPAMMRNDDDTIESMAAALDAQFDDLEARLKRSLDRVKAVARAEGVVDQPNFSNQHPVKIQSFSQGFGRWANMVMLMDEVCSITDAMWHDGKMASAARHREQNELRNILSKFKRRLVTEKIAALKFVDRQRRERELRSEGAQENEDAARANRITLAQTKSKRVRTKRKPAAEVRDVTDEVVGVAAPEIVAEVASEAVIAQAA